jgi:hypothetical protein
VDADAFLRRLADVLMQIKDEKAQPQTDLLHD